ncbi:hypothetical protein DERP_014819 [Dermatophagoides pteronyssinus]|uniref:Uncharacterized protein n=1 Tax=Dermatophagoides pteronyssinus TaxID=6956 RepID=A0ABQ8J342_DERPT|nr:hypothetical protein DERP_014819 [Dermatophagoides pteronyssinus]
MLWNLSSSSSPLLSIISSVPNSSNRSSLSINSVSVNLFGLFRFTSANFLPALNIIAHGGDK